MALLTLARVFVGVSAGWALVALGVQVLSAWGGGRRDYSVRTGSPWRGIAYSFTVAMAPTHKESIKRHPLEFGIGLLMHVGVLVALAGLVLMVVAPDAGVALLAATRVLAGVSLPAGLLLLVRRMRSPNLRAMSVPDDYLAVGATCVLLGLALPATAGSTAQLAFLMYGGALLIYLPLGKLRHAVFFFVARGDYGRRLGYRGVYPPAALDTRV